MLDRWSGAEAGVATGGRREPVLGGSAIAVLAIDAAGRDPGLVPIRAPCRLRAHGGSLWRAEGLEA